MHITPNVIKEYAKAKGLRFSEDLPQSFARYYSESINEYNSETHNIYRIGLELEPNIYYWFSCYINTIEDFEKELSFEQRYNRANGAKQTSYKKGFKAIEKITNFINN